MYCPNCGKDAGDSKFCPDCGTKVEVIKNAEEANPSNSSLGYEEIRDAHYEAAEKIENKKGKKKLIGCLTPIIIIAVVIAGIFVALKVKTMGPASDISFSEVYSAYSSNATSASKTYDGKKFTFYFIPYKISEYGTCNGTVYDSFGKAWKWYERNDKRISYLFDVQFSDDADSIRKGQLYKIEGVIDLNYSSDSNDFHFNTIKSAKIIEKDPVIELKNN